MSPTVDDDPAAVLYIKIYTMVLDDPDKMRLSFSAFGLWAIMLAIAKRSVTDGFVSQAHVEREAAGRGDDWQEPISELERAGAIEEAADGWLMTGWLNHNKSVDAIGSERTARKDSSAQGNHQRWCVNKGRRRPDCPVCHGKPLVNPGMESGGSPIGGPNGVGEESTEVEVEGERKEEVEGTLPSSSTVYPRPVDNRASDDGGVRESEPETTEHPANRILAPLGIVGAEPTAGERQTVGRAIERGWTIDQLVDLAHIAATEGGNPRPYLLGMLEKRANTIPPPTPPPEPRPAQLAQGGMSPQVGPRLAADEGWDTPEVTANGLAAARAALPRNRKQETP